MDDEGGFFVPMDFMEGWDDYPMIEKPSLFWKFIRSYGQIFGNKYITLGYERSKIAIHHKGMKEIIKEW